MPVELVKAPYVVLAAYPYINPNAIIDFATDHGLANLVQDDSTPISKLVDAASNGISDGDTLVEFAGRFCYRSWAKGRSSEEYIDNILKEKHGNVLAHAHYSFIVTGVSRSLTHELIRHHVGTNPSQESQRYVTAEGGEIEVIGYKAMRAVVPPLILKYAESFDLDAYQQQFEVELSFYHSWLRYLKGKLATDESLPDHAPTIIKKRANEAARAFLPNACETRLVWTMNIRSARWMIEQRGSEHADLEIRRLAIEFLKIMKEAAPLSFADMVIYTADDGFDAVAVGNSKV